MIIVPYCIGDLKKGLYFILENCPGGAQEDQDSP